ncbi:polysaccharide biosynthesis C-terminal domain-containing protein [Halobacterium sp. MBLA0001]|uniref:lipid II flippase MurJ n=1 Tax=Halobacterium sp. MBLA0001 TaxID=3413511 RepID=UPI003C765890
MKIGRTTSIVFLTRTLSAVLSFIGVAFFAREIGAAALGIFFLFRASVSFLGIPADFGLRIAVERRISVNNRPATVFSTSALLKLASVTVISLFIVAFRGYLTQYIGADLVILLILALLFDQLSDLTLVVLRGEHRVAESAVVGFIYRVTWIAAGTIAVTQGHGATGLASSLVLGYVVRLTLGLIIQDTGFAFPSLEIIPSLLRYASYSSISVVGGTIHNTMDLMILGFFYASSMVGIYETAWQIGGPVLILTKAIGSTIFPQISSWDASESYEKIEDLISKVITPSLSVVIPAVFGTVLLSREILGVIYGPGFIAGWDALIIIIAGQVPRTIRHIVGRTLFAMDKPRYVAIGGVVDISLNLVLNLIFIYYFGLVGAALGTMLSMSAGMIVRIYFLKQFVSPHVPYDELAWCTISSVIMALVVYALETFVGIDSVVELFFVIGVGVAVYFLALFSSTTFQKRYIPNKVL